MTTATNHALRPALLLFGIMLAHALLETARDALFLVRLGPTQLAWAYLAIAGTAVAAVAAHRRWGRDRDPRRVLVGFLSLATAGTGVLATSIAVAPPAVFVLYVWTGLVATLVVPAFWTLIDRGVRVGDAKRVFSAIAAGGVLGALAGSALATAISWLVGATALVWFGTAVFAACSLLAAVLVPQIGPELPRTHVEDRSMSHRRSRRYVRVLLLGGLFATVALTLGDLMFKRFLAGHVEGDHLSTAFGAIYAGLNLLGLVIQLAITPRLFERLGVGSTLTILPVLLIVSALGFAITGGVIAIMALKLADGGLRHSVYRVANEILFLPLPAKLRDSTKPMIDAIGMRGGQALAAVVSFVVAGGDDNSTLGAATVVAAVVWLIVVFVTRSQYVQQFRDTLDAGDIQRDVAVPTLDGRSISILTAALSSPDEAEARAALDLLSRRGDRIPALVLYHPSPAIVRRALSLLEGTLRSDVERVLRHLTSHADPAIRAAAFAAASRTGCGDCLAMALDDPEPEVRAAAIVGLAVVKQDLTGLEALLARSTAERVALAHAIGRDPKPMFGSVLDALLARRETAVTREVLRIWAHSPALGDGTRLLELLADPNVRGDARRAIVAGGSRYFDQLLGALDDPRTPIGVRRHLPRTISRFKSASAATALVSRLVREPDGTTEFKILRALGRMRVDDPAIPIDVDTINLYVRRASDDVMRYSALAQRLDAEANHNEPSIGLLRELLVEKRVHAIERVFRALGIVNPRADLRGVYDGITSGDPLRRDAAREVLEALLPSPVRAAVLAALSPAAVRHTTYEALFAALLTDPSDSLRCIAAHHIAERRLVALRPELTRLRPYSSSLVGHAFDQAIARLDAR